MGRREEKELFAEFIEDYNTGTLQSEKYVDLEKFRENEKSKEGKATQTAATAVSDEEALRLARQRQRAADQTMAESARLELMKQALQAAKQRNSSDWMEIQRRNAVKEPTFESIAKQREMEKKIKEAEARQRGR